MRSPKRGEDESTISEFYVEICMMISSEIGPTVGSMSTRSEVFRKLSFLSGSDTRERRATEAQALCCLVVSIKWQLESYSNACFGRESKRLCVKDSRSF